MPIYEYKCETCGSCFEKLTFAGDDETPPCPACGTKDVKKQMSCASFMNSGLGEVCKSPAATGVS